LKRFKLSDASGKLTFTQLQEGELDRSALDSNDSFIIDNGSEVFVWIGKKVGQFLVFFLLQSIYSTNFVPPIRRQMLSEFKDPSI
jgi:hypothetical protein